MWSWNRHRTQKNTMIGRRKWEDWTLKKLKIRTEDQKTQQWQLEDLVKVEKKRQEGEQTANVIQAIITGMEVSLLYYMSVLIVLELAQ